MLRLLSLAEQDYSHITLQTTELAAADQVVYVVYDTSTGTPTYDMDDYYGWRTSTTLTSTGAAEFEISNTTIYPNFSNTITDYSIMRPRHLYSMTFTEYTILQHVLTRIDLVRKRLPNPGFGISSTNSVGQNGTVSFSGGYEKKFSVDELRQMIEGAIVEVNWTSPQTSFWPQFTSLASETVANPYMRNDGLPFDMIDLVTQGTILRALVAWGFLEVDLSFSTSDSGLQITFDRVNHVKGWRADLLQEYEAKKQLFKMNYANFYGVGVGTFPFAASSVLGVGWNNAQYGGQMALSSLTGWSIRGTTPL